MSVKPSRSISVSGSPSLSRTGLPSVSSFGTVTSQLYARSVARTSAGQAVSAALGISFPITRQVAGLAVAVCASALPAASVAADARSEEHTSELQSLMRISYAVFCLKKQQYKG